MKIVITNNIELIEFPTKIISYLISALTVVNPLYESNKNNGYTTYGIEPFIYNFSWKMDNLIIPRGCLYKLIAYLKDDYNYDILDLRHLEFIPFVGSKGYNFYDYQLNAINEILSKNIPNGIIIGPPACGKTFMGMNLISVYMQKTLWITHTKTLLKQAVDRANEFLILNDGDVGVIGDGKWNIGNILTCATVQTLIRRPEQTDSLKNIFGMVVIDEVHHAPAKTFLQVISSLNPYYMYGLTATINRKDGLTPLIYNIIGDIITKINIEDVKEHITIPTVIPIEINICYIPEDRGGDLEYITTELINCYERNKFITDMMISEAKNNNYCFVTSSRKIHCEILYELIKTTYNSVEVVTGDTSKKIAEKIIDDFNKKKFNILISTNSLLSEGYDAPHINKVFIASPFRNETLAEQIIGRAQRKSDDKMSSEIYDFIDTNIGLIKNQYENKYYGRLNGYLRAGAKINE